MKLISKLTVGALAPATLVVVSGWLVQEHHSRNSALRQAQSSLDECASLTANLVERSLEQVLADLVVLSTQSSFSEYLMFTRVGLLDDAEQQRLRIEEAALLLTENRGAYRVFEFHDADGRGVVRVEHGVPILRYTSAASTPWFSEAMDRGYSVIPAAGNSMRIASRVRVDGKSLGVVSVACEGESLLSPVLTYGAQTARGRGVRLEGEAAGFLLEANWASDRDDRAIESRIALESPKGVVVVVRQPVTAAIAQHISATRGFSTSLLILTAAVLALVLVAVRVFVLRPLRSIHIKAVAFQEGKNLPSTMLAQRDELGDLDRALTGAVTQLTDTLTSVRMLNEELEAKVEQRTSQLAESEAKTRAIVETAADGIITIDEGGVILSANGAAEQMFGYAPDELVGTNVSVLMPSPYREQHDGYLRKYIETGVKNIMGSRREAVAQRKDGATFPVDLSVMELRLGGGRIFTGMICDITERKKGDAELLDARAAAEEASSAKSNFLANMSHEIRTPMNGIIGMSELALDTDLDHEQRDYLNTVLECSSSLLTLLNDILDFSKIEAGRLELETIDFDIIDTVEGVADLLTQRATEKGVELICNVRPDVPNWLRGDPGRLRQVLVNLAGNAIKFTEHGEVVVSAQVTKQDGDGVTIMLSVSDTGVGIPPDRQTAIFESFTQVDSATTRKFGGTGLGLAISRQIVQLMDGDIWLESEPGHGSTFFVSVTLERGSNPDESETSPETLQDRRILVVDDNTTNLTILQSMLQAWGCRITTAESGKEALKLLQLSSEAGNAFDLVVLDVQMPYMDGIQVAQAIDGDGCYGRPPVVLASSLGTRSEMARNREFRCAACLTKPLKQVVLRDTLERVLTPTMTAAPDGHANCVPTPTDRRRYDARILIVEDNPVNQKLIVRILEKAGCDTTTAENGRIALDVLARKSFDLVFMDVQMPEMDGHEATRRIRKDERLQNLPVVAMTAHAMKGDRDQCLDAGMNDYVTKPIKTDEVLAMIDKWANLPESPDQPGVSETRVTGVPERQAQPPEAAIDIEKALINLDGDRELLEDVVGIFLDTIPATLQQLQSAASTRDAAKLEAAAHSLKGAASNIYAEPVRSTAQQLEDMGRRKVLTNVDAIVAELCHHIECLRASAKELQLV